MLKKGEFATKTGISILLFFAVSQNGGV